MVSLFWNIRGTTGDKTKTFNTINAILLTRLKTKLHLKIVYKCENPLLQPSLLLHIFAWWTHSLLHMRLIVKKPVNATKYLPQHVFKDLLIRKLSFMHTAHLLCRYHNRNVPFNRETRFNLISEKIINLIFCPYEHFFFILVYYRPGPYALWRPTLLP